MKTRKLATILLATAFPLTAQAVPRDDLTQVEHARVEKVTRPTTDFSRAEPFEAMPGGAGTFDNKPNRRAFMHPSANLDADALLDHKLGKALFEKFWVSSPSSTQASDGLGPLYNARSCHSCHLRNGRGEPPRADGDATSFVLRLAQDPQTDVEKQALATGRLMNIPDPVYGGQLQDFAVAGLLAEGSPRVEYSDLEVRMADGSTVTLRQPGYSIVDRAYGPLSPQTSLSPRIAQPMIGLGLIEAIAPADILSRADPEDANADGISGRPSLVADGGNGKALGLFGWKAQHATVRAQSAAALNTDIGISSPDQPNAHGDCTAREKDCLALPTGVQTRLGDTEAPDPVMDLITAYAASLAVPARRDVDDPQVLQGKEHFYEADCIACHRPKFVTRRDAAHRANAFQLIWPYSDFLLHDMGESLADGQRVGEATGREWRTAPLWGIGLNGKVNGRLFFMHDGRARSLEEAILWHGGEAELSKKHYTNMEKQDRDALIRFLESL